MKQHFLLCSSVVVLSSAAARAGSGGEIVRGSGVDGGLVVCVGLDDPPFLVQLRADGRYLVHGVDVDAAKVEQARRRVRSRDLLGSVSVSRFDGVHLPYVHNLVSLIVTRGTSDVARGEIERVLAPRGVAIWLDRRGAVSSGKTYTKPVPAEIDDWTHFLHSPTNNAVSRDTVVAPPRRMQWIAGPRYARHHDKMSSVSAVVCADGKVFTIIDEGPLWSIVVPPRWALTARDAFNGKLLWKRPIGEWHNHLWGLKSGPASLPRRLVAAGDRVYATLGLKSPVSQIDAATGETIRDYEGTDGTTEILLESGTLYLVSGGLPAKGPWFGEAERTLMALSAETGRMLWRAKKWVVPGTLSVLERDLYFFEKDRAVCLDAASGARKWQSDPIPRPARFPSNYTPTLVATPGVVLISGGEAAGLKVFGRWSTAGAKDTITALDAATGRKMWSAHHPDSGYRSPEDVLVIDGTVWFGDSRDGAKPGNTYGLDLMTGAVKATFPPDRDIYFFHHRCHRGKATVNYLMTSRAGIEFIDFRSKHWDVNHWIRGACLYGVVPANGLVYAPQHPCACYLESKLDGFNAVAPANDTPRLPARLPRRLERGPVYGTRPGGGISTAGDWPTYRHDVQRSGSTRTEVPGSLARTFAIEIGGKLSSPVVGSGLVLVSAIDAHTIHAYDAATGQPRWDYVCGGRVDSPPTILGDLVLFGCRDGHVYCLRSSDGQLVWKFRAAPLDERIVVCERLESVWPVHGSVLVRDNVLYTVAGRSTFLDGGLRLVRLDPASGELQGETVMDGHQKLDGKDHQDYVSWLNMPPARPDILSATGEYIYMGSQAFRPDGARLPLKAKPRGRGADAGAPPPRQDAAHAHVFSPTGFLDGTGWHRTYWIYGSDFYSGWCGYPTAGKATPAGKILVIDERQVYGFGRLPRYWRWTTPMEFHLFGVSRDKVDRMKFPAPARRRKGGKGATQKAAGGTPDSSYTWTQRYPVLVRAMVKAGDTVFIAGPPDVLDETRTSPAKTREQVAAWNGLVGVRGGAVMMAVSAADGSRKATYQLGSVPVFDGLIAARGRLYVATTGGRLECWRGE